MTRYTALESDTLIAYMQLRGHTSSTIYVKSIQEHHNDNLSVERKVKNVQDLDHSQYTPSTLYSSWMLLAKGLHQLFP